MLYSDGNDLESTISKIVSGRFLLLLVVVSCWLLEKEDGCLISLVNDSFPVSAVEICEWVHKM